MSDQTIRCVLCGCEGPAHDCTTSACREATLARIAKLEQLVENLVKIIAARHDYGPAFHHQRRWEREP
jgi:hypothetical protein